MGINKSKRVLMRASELRLTYAYTRHLLHVRLDKSQLGLGRPASSQWPTTVVTCPRSRTGNPPRSVHRRLFPLSLSRFRYRPRLVAGLVAA